MCHYKQALLSEEPGGEDLRRNIVPKEGNSASPSAGVLYHFPVRCSSQTSGWSGVQTALA